MEMTSKLSRRERLAALVLLALFCSFGLFDHTLWSANDTREGAMIAAMARGGSWTLPQLNGVPYLEKPPLLHWTGAALCGWVGTVNEGLVRLPAALFGCGALLLIWQFGRALGRERAGLIAALLCATTQLMAEYSRVVLTDTALTFMVLLALWLFWRAYSAATGRAARYAVFLSVTALAFYAKGLLGPGFVWVSVGLFLLWRREGRLLCGLSLAFLPIGALVLAPWVVALWHAGGKDFLVGVFWDNQFGRFLSFRADAALPPDPYFVHKEPLWYYLKSAPLRLLPWTLLVVAALAQWFRRGRAYRGDLALFVRLAVVAMAVVLHVSSAKTACYVLPLFPLLLLMTGLWLEDTLPPNAQHWWERAALRLTLGVLVLAALLAPVGLLVANAGHWTLGARSYWPGAALASYSVVMAALALGLALAFGLRLRRATAQEILWHGPFMLIVLLVLNGAAILPVLDAAKTYRPVAELVRRHVAGDGRIALAHAVKAGVDERDTGALTFYLGRNLDAVPLDAQLADYLCAGRRPVGVVIPAAAYALAQQLLAGRAVRFLQTPHPGYKARDYWLLVPAR